MYHGLFDMFLMFILHVKLKHYFPFYCILNFASASFKIIFIDFLRTYETRFTVILIFLTNTDIVINAG